MNILKLQGLDGRLFDLVAPLVYRRENRTIPAHGGSVQGIHPKKRQLPRIP